MSNSIPHLLERILQLPCGVTRVLAAKILKTSDMEVVKGHAVASRTRSKSKKGGKYSHSDSLTQDDSVIIVACSRANESVKSFPATGVKLNDTNFEIIFFKALQEEEGQARNAEAAMMPCEPQRWQLIGARHCDPKLIN